MTPSPRLIAVGDNCLDVYLGRGRMAAGGNALNVAAQWRRRGLAVRYFGAVGSDAEGALMLQAIAGAGLDAADVEQRPGHTAVTLLRDRNGDRRFLLEDLGVGRDFVPEPGRLALLDAAAWVHLGTNASPALLRHLLARGLGFSVDVSTAHGALDVAGVPLVAAAGPEGEAEPAEPLIARFLDRGARRVLLTCGRRGAYYHDGTTLHRVAAERVEVVDTCGAGDSFIAAFIAGHIIEGLPAGTALAGAASAAAQTCTHPGGFPQPLVAIPGWLARKYAAVIETPED